MKTWTVASVLWRGSLRPLALDMPIASAIAALLVLAAASSSTGRAAEALIFARHAPAGATARLGEPMAAGASEADVILGASITTPEALRPGGPIIVAGGSIAVHLVDELEPYLDRLVGDGNLGSRTGGPGALIDDVTARRLKIGPGADTVVVLFGTTLAGSERSVATVRIRVAGLLRAGLHRAVAPGTTDEGLIIVTADDAGPLARLRSPTDDTRAALVAEGRLRQITSVETGDAAAPDLQASTRRRLLSAALGPGAVVAQVAAIALWSSTVTRVQARAVRSAGRRTVLLSLLGVRLAAIRLLVAPPLLLSTVLPLLGVAAFAPFDGASWPVDVVTLVPLGAASLCFAWRAARRALGTATASGLRSLGIIEQA